MPQKLCHSQPRATRRVDGQTLGLDVPSGAKTFASITGVARYLRTYEAHAPREQSVRSLGCLRGSDSTKCSLTRGKTAAWLAGYDVQLRKEEPLC